jgi:hypothetical protein
MKRFLSLLLTLTLVVTFIGLGSAEIKASDVPASDCTTARHVVLHYKRWNDDYENMDFWAWGTGTNGSGNPQIVGQDDFGAVAYLCVDDDADGQAGLIPRLNDWSYKDGTNGGEDKFVPLREDVTDNTSDFAGFDENGVKHVYILQGSQTVYEVDMTLPYFQADGFGTLVVIYYETTEMYEGWNMWNWGTGTGGTAAGDAFGGSGVPFQYDLGIDQGPEPGKFKVAVFNIAADADDTMGFIVRTDAWEKQWADDLFIDISGIKGSGTQFTFYIGGTPNFYDNFADFEAAVNFFEIDSAMALDPNSIEVVFNKDVITVEDEVDVFNDGAFMVKDVAGNEIEITRVSYNSTTDVNNTFTLITEEALTGEGSPYKVYYMPGGSELYTKQFEVDNVAPVITIIGNTDVELELGDSYSLPTFSASDMVGDESVAVYNVRVKDGHGTVDTRNAGIYEIVIEAHDKFGNVAEEVITVTVMDPCDDTAHLDANAGFSNYIALIVGLPLLAGAFITLRRSI